MSLEPRSRLSTPLLSSSRSASRTVPRCTPNWRASSISGGSRSPALMVRSVIRSEQRGGHLAIGRLDADRGELQRRSG